MNFNEEIGKEFKQLQNYAYLICGQRNLMHVADELLQEASITALELDEDSKKIIREPVAYVKALMRRFVMLPNTKFYRAYINPTKKTVSLQEGFFGSDDEYYPELYTHTCQLLECCFSWNDRQMFYLHLKRGWSAADISEFTGIPYRTVRDRINLTKERLRVMMEHASE